jgi:hypothetical protein
MSGKNSVNLEKILNHPQVKNAIDDINPELRERREYRPPQCEVFTMPYTILRETDEFHFELDREAEKQLPNIIGNKVQLIEGRDTVDDETAAQYGKKCHIGIVFSGGPAPGGHNVIAGLYDAAKEQLFRGGNMAEERSVREGTRWVADAGPHLPTEEVHVSAGLHLRDVVLQGQRYPNAEA